MTAPEAPVVTGEIEVKRVVSLFSPLVLLGCIVMMAFVVYLMWKSDKRAASSDAAFRDAVHTVKERGETDNRVPTAENREGYSAINCGPECSQGHTYRDGCSYHVNVEPGPADLPTDSDGSDVGPEKM